MSTFTLSCESTVDLPFSYVNSRDIPVLFYEYSIDGQPYPDDMLRDPAALPRFYQFLDDGKMPSTSQLNEFDYESFFEAQLQKGDLLHIEAVAVPGTGKLELTGSLGDVMKESAQAAITYIRAHASELSVEPDFYKKKDIHIHVPEGAVPKDGPSAGVTIATALASELSGRAVRRDVAMTGEITLHGKVLPIGGLREKAMAAYKTGVKTVLIPRSNLRDLEEIDPVVREKLNFIPCSRVSEVFGEALI